LLKEMSLSNFKAFGEEQKLLLAPITLLYGPNSSGKSSLIQSLLLLKQSFQNTSLNAPFLTTKGEIIDLASFNSMIFKHDIKKNFKIELLFDFPKKLIFGARIKYDKVKVCLEY